MGRGRRGDASVIKIGMDHATEGDDVGGGNRKGKGRPGPATLKAKKSRSVDKILGVGDLHPPPLGAIGARDEPEVGDEATHGHGLLSPPPLPSLCVRAEIGLGGVRGDDVFDDDDEEDDAEGEEDEGAGAPWGRQSDWTAEQGKEEKRKRTGLEVIYVPVEIVTAAVGRGRGRGRGIGGEVRRSERIGSGLEEACYVFDGLLLAQGRDHWSIGAGEGRRKMDASDRGADCVVPRGEQGVGPRVMSSEGRGSIIEEQCSNRPQHREEQAGPEGWSDTGRGEGPRAQQGDVVDVRARAAGGRPVRTELRAGAAGGDDVVAPKQRAHHVLDQMPVREFDVGTICTGLELMGTSAGKLVEDGASKRAPYSYMRLS